MISVFYILVFVEFVSSDYEFDNQTILSLIDGTDDVFFTDDDEFFVSNDDDVFVTNNDDVFITDKLIQGARTKKHLVNISIYQPLESYQVSATPIPVTAYPWIGRAVHSLTNDYPHICTVSCIDKFIFITASRCLFALRVRYTRIIYDGHNFLAKAFVSPSVETQQSFDDVGFIVVSKNNTYGGSWPSVSVYDKARTDDNFQWFKDFLAAEGAGNHKVIGWAVKKWNQFRLKNPRTEYGLSELEVVLGFDMCSKIYSANYHNINGFYVPCYFGCDFDEFSKDRKSAKCNRAHGVLGGALYNFKTNKLFGIATWGSYYSNYELPIGFSAVNSKRFFEDKACAFRIRDDTTEDLEAGYLQSLCPE